MFGTLAPKRGGLRRAGPRAGFLDEIEDAVSRMWETGFDGLTLNAAVPSLDVSETDKAVEVKLDVPGMTAKDIDIQLNGNLLTVGGERKEEQEKKGKLYHRVERRYGSFSRSITLPAKVVEDEVAAEYHEGVLTITLPKTEDAKSKKIAVKS